MTDRKSEKPGKLGTSEVDQTFGARRSDKTVGLGREIQAKIGQHLRTMYDEVVKEGVPEDLEKLLRELDKPSDGEPRK